MKSRGVRLFAVTALSVCVTAACDPQPAKPQSQEKVPITTVSDEARAAYLQGRNLLDGLRFTDAHRFFVEATELDPNFALAWLATANTSPTAHEFFAALRNATENASGTSDGEQMMIRAFEAGVNADPETQRSELEALVAAYPGDERAYNSLAIFLFGQQEYESAITGYRKAIAINPDVAQPYNQLGYALRFTGDFDGAERAFKRYIELIPDQPNPYDSYAELLMKMGKFEESIRSYEKALAVEPTFISSYIGIANDYIYLDQPQQARRALLRIADVARGNNELRQMHTWIAATYLHERDFDRALAEVQRRYDVAAETEDLPAMAGDLNLMGTVLLEAGRTEEAAFKFEQSVAMMDGSDATDDIKETVHRNHIADSVRVALSRGELEEAAELADAYRTEVARHNVRIEVQQSRELDGLIALASGEPQAALFELANANQQNPRVLFLNARAFAAAGDRQAARAACRDVINFNQLNFNLAFVRGQARAMLDELDAPA